MNLLVYFLLLLKASLFSTGGMGNMPSIHADFIARRWATERQFGESLAVGQFSPGPTGLWLIAFGYLTAGWLGSLLALVAITIPPFLVLATDRLYRRVAHHPAVEGFMRGLSLSVVGIFVVVLSRLLGSAGLSVKTIAIALGALGLGALRRVPVWAILGAAGVAGYALH
jgi:chromate transporter